MTQQATQTYEIENTTSGHSLGHYESPCKLDAYNSMMNDAGYALSDEIPADINVTEI